MNELSITQRLLRIYPRFKYPVYAWVVAALAIVLGAALEPAIPALLKPLFDSGFSSGKIPLWFIPLALLGLFTLRGLASFLSAISLAKIAQYSLQKLRLDMFARITNAEIGLYRNQPATTLANTLVFEASNGAILLLQSITTIVKDSFSIVALLMYLFFLNWKLTLVVVCLLPIVAITMRLFAKRLYRLTKDAQVATDKLAYVVEENVLAHKEIRLQGAQAQQQHRFEQVNILLSRISMKTAIAGSALTPITQVFGALALSVVVTIALLESNTNSLSAGGFIAFITAMLMLIAPIKHLSEVASTVTRGLVAMERSIALLETVPIEKGGHHIINRCNGALSLRSVQVRYPGSDTYTLSNIDVEVSVGQFVALIGLSGSGKTTLAQLLPRLVDYESGHIYLDGVELRDWDIRSLRSQFALVGQNVVMLNDSIIKNVALGQKIDRDRVEQCLNAANLGTYIKSLPLGMDTVVGHNASTLSGGEKQRLAIARAMYKDAPILLLDEVTSALDADTERLVQDALRKVMDGRTTIAIAHRIATVRDADKIIVLQAGKIVQQGNHQTLLDVDGAYKDFVKLSHF